MNEGLRLFHWFGNKNKIAFESRHNPA